MKSHDKEIVSAIEAALVTRVGSQRYDLWFKANARLDVDSQRLRIRVPNRFFLDWLSHSFRVDIESACREVLGSALPLSFQIDESMADEAEANEPVEDGRHVSTAAADNGSPSSSADAPATLAMNPPRASTEHAKRPRRHLAALKKFVVGDSNRVAHTSAEMVVSRPGRISPLLICGPTGCGKTHLLEGITAAFHSAHPRARVMLLSAEQFTSQFVTALRGSGLPNLRRKYRGLGLLAIDDAQFFLGKRATLVELLHTVNTLVEEGRQLVLAADRPPSELPGLGDELRTRITGGMVCRIEPAEYETRLGIVRSLAGRCSCKIPAAVQEFVAARFTTHARELIGAINRLEATSQAIVQGVSLRMAEEALADLILHARPAVQIADVEKAVCNVFGLETKSLHSNGRTRHVSQPRMLAMWLARKHTRAALSEISTYFGRKSHTTVLSAQRKVDTWVSKHAALELPAGSYSVEDAIRKVEQDLRVG